MDLKLLNNLMAGAKEVYPDNKILQQVVVTQAIHESNFLGKSGGSQLALRYNNLFGIKGKGDAGSVLLPTWEHINGKDIQVKDNFAVYSSHAACMARHADLIHKPIYRRVLNAMSCPEAFKALTGVWATDPKYYVKLQAIWEKYVKINY